MDEFLTVSAPDMLIVASYNSGVVHLTWQSGGYDKTLLAWGTSHEEPTQIELGGSARSYDVGGIEPGSAYFFRIKSGKFLGVISIPPWNYSDWCEITWMGGMYLLLYKGGTGQARITQRIGTETSLALASPCVIGGWEGDWVQVVPFEYRGKRYVTYYAADGRAYGAPMITGANGPQNGNSYKMGDWQRNWARIASFSFRGKSYMLFYGRNGQARVHELVDGRSNVAGQPVLGFGYDIGGWERDWDQITPVEFSGEVYLHFYRKSDGFSYIAPMVQGVNGPKNAAGIELAKWSTNWAHISSFRFKDNAALFMVQDDGTTFMAPCVTIGGTMTIAQPQAVGGVGAGWTIARGFSG